MKRRRLASDRVIAGLEPSEAARLLRALSSAAIIAKPKGRQAVTIPTRGNRIFAADEIERVVDEALQGRVATHSARQETPIRERAPATQIA
jgi:hypothetical protein